MEYRAVGNRCAVDIEALRLPISREETLAILTKKGFKVVEVDLIALARQCVGLSKHRWDAKFSEAPAIVNCFSFTKWLYGMRGIWLPRRHIQQRECGESVELNEITAGNLIFTSGHVDLHNEDSADDVGHVCLAASDKTVICATYSKLGRGVVEIARETLFNQRKFRGARRYIPKGSEVITLETPVNREVEIADDIRWIVLQSLTQKK